MDNLDIKQVNKLFKEGQNDLKTSLFSLKFSPDYLSAVVHFTDAAKAYKKLGKLEESLNAYEHAIKCNKQLHESWAEGQNWIEMGNIYCFDLNEYEKGIECYNNASMSIKISGKIHSGIKVYSDVADRFIEKNNFELGLRMLIVDYNDTVDNLHEEIIRITLDEICNKMIDNYCKLEKFKEAIIFLNKHINIQKGISGEKKYKITKNYIKLGMLMIIVKEAYMIDNIINDMYSNYDSSCGDDIDDIRELSKAYNEINKQKFNYLITYAFSLFQNNLLKALKKAFDDKSLAVNNEIRIQERNVRA